MIGSNGRYADIHIKLVERCKNNDKQAYTELYRYYSRSVYNTCLRIIKNSGTAEDLMQETFITAFEKIESFKGDSTFGAWIKRIAVNKSIDEVRRNLSIFEPINETRENTLIDPKGVPDDYDTEISGKVEIVKKAMEILPVGYRIVISLYLFEGYDHEEIAQILGVAESTSRSQYTRAKQKLVEIINTTFNGRME